MYTKKIIVAGPLVKVCLYPRVLPSDNQRTRGEKRKASSDAQKRMNAIYSWQKLELMLGANFRKGDIVGCLTFNDRKLPDRRDCCRNKLNWFLCKLRAARDARGQDTRFIWSIEHKHRRWHIHFVLNATGDDYAEIWRLWGQGSVDLRPLRVDKDKNYESQARYMTKESPDKLGQRGWSYTRSCFKPEIETFPVPDGTKISSPDDALVFESVSHDSTWGSYEYIKYAYEGALK